MTGTNLFCEKCLLQFDKKIVYDIHLSFVHNVKETKDEKLTENNEKDRGLCLSSKSEKPCETFVNPGIVPKEKSSHKCPICDYSSSNTGHLKRHIDSVHGGKKPHKCSICDQSFALKGHLKRHIDSVHEKYKPYKCPICDYNFSLKGHLKRHIDSIHDG